MKKLNHFFLTAFALACLVTAAVADDKLLNQSHPDRYVVKKGDTLWDIAGLFLREPWRWPDIWHVNPQVKNPHLIYPGDELELVYIDGDPQLRLNRGHRDVKLSPQVRVTPWDGSIPTIPLDVIAPFLTRPYVVAEGQLDNAPYIVDFADEHIVAGAGQRIYVRKLTDPQSENYDVVRPGGPYQDADTGEILGYEALFVGATTLQQVGDPSTLLITAAEIEASKGDRLIATESSFPVADFHPKPPAEEVNGSIIGVLHGVTQIGQYNVVVLDRGDADGLSPGTVLRVEHRGEVVPDQVARKEARKVAGMNPYIIEHDPEAEVPTAEEKRLSPWETVKLPDEKAGHLMVFRTFDRVSFGLVMEATRAIHVMDRVRNP